MRVLRTFFFLGCIFFWVFPAAAGQICTEALRQSMAEAGLTTTQVRGICQRATEIEAEARPPVTAEQIEKDISGKILGTWIFQKSEWRDIDILEADYSGDKAKIEVNIDTIRNKSGRVRLRYQWTDGRWKLYRLFNVDFQ